MSGELQIVFIYDTLACRKEEDDPKDAILYFHPTCIPEERRLAICGQLMGLSFFLNDLFSAPKILTLENGKFALRKFSIRHILAVGCSSVTPDWLLEKQADILYQLTKFFHKDIDSILSSVKGDRFFFSTKLASIMEHYIPISQHHGDLFALTFGILPLLDVPKSSNNIFLTASLILQTCMLQPGVLGGVIMHQNKVVGAQSCQEVARKLAFIQPYQLPPAEPFNTAYSLPQGVKLFIVYLNKVEIKQLVQDSESFQNPSKVITNDQVSKVKNSSITISSIQEEEPLEQSSSLGFSEPSINLSESSKGGEESSSGNRLKYFKPSSAVEASKLISDSGDKNEFHKAKKPNVEKEAVAKEDNNEKKPSFINFVELETCKPANNSHSSLFCNSKCFKSATNINIIDSDSDNEETTPNIALARIRRCESLADPYFPVLRSNGKCISKYLIEEFSISRENPNDLESQNTTESENPVNTEDNEASNSEVILQSDSLISQSIGELSQEHPPKSPLETSTPNNASKRPINLPLNTSNSTTPKIKAKSKYRRWSNYNDVLSPVIDTPSPGFLCPRINAAEFNKEVWTEKVNRSTEDEKDPVPLRILSSFRRLSSTEDVSQLYSTTSDCEAYVQNNPCEHRKSLTKSSHSRLQKHPDESNDYQEVCLFIYSSGSMRLLLLLDMKCANDPSLINTLWDSGSTSINELETCINNVDEQSTSINSDQRENYCYLHFEPIWKSLSHGGRNHTMDFDVVQQMHQDFFVHSNITEITIRGQDHVVYGYQCVGSEVFYQQSANYQSGLPMPTDLMGKVPMKAKRRLERDHNILLL